MTNPIKKRVYYQIEITVDSPISVSSGEDLNTDSDVLKNGNREYFVPGTSLSGAFRNYLGKKKEVNCIFGFSNQQSGKMSSVFVSDLYFDSSKVTKSIRDGVALDDEKTVDNKFDMEIIEPGVASILSLEVILRENQGNDDDYESQINTILSAVQNGEIRIGSNKNRGFGRLKINGIREKSFDKNNAEEWIAFCKTGDLFTETESFEEWLEKKSVEEGKQFVKVQIPLRLKGGISIRRYSAEPGKADYSHITCNGKPVVPGSSWNGAIRSDAKNILRQLGCSEEKTSALIKKWFGYVDVGTSKAMQSNIVISESVLADAEKNDKNARALPMSRNSVDRFTAGAASLYSEIACFDGKTTLEYMVKKDKDGPGKNKNEYLALLGLMELVTEDIQKGYVAVGGQTAIGRGIFSADETKKAIYSEEIDPKKCLNELYRVIKEDYRDENR